MSPALTADRHTPYREGELMSFPLAAGVTVYAGALVVARPNGYAAPGSEAVGLVPLGRAEEQVSNVGGADGTVSVVVRRKGVFRWSNSPDQPVTVAHIGSPCYILDDQTVAREAALVRSVAGQVVGVDAKGVWVQIRPVGISAALNLNFPSVAARGKQELTIPTPGASVGETVVVGHPISPPSGLVIQAYVSAPDTVTVRATNITSAAIDPPANTYRVLVIR